MSADRSLFERLEMATDERPVAEAPFDTSVLIESVLRNIRRVLNERHGSCEIRGDYGLPDLNDAMSRGGGPAQLGSTIGESIAKFEPRLSDVLVRFITDPDHPMRLNFRIAAVMHVGENRERVAFDTIMSEDKRIHVRG